MKEKLRENEETVEVTADVQVVDIIAKEEKTNSEIVEEERIQTLETSSSKKGLIIGIVAAIIVLLVVLVELF